MQTDATRNRPGLEAAVTAAGHAWGHHDGQPWESDEAAIAAIVAAHTLAHGIAARIGEVKALAGSRILIRHPVERQAKLADDMGRPAGHPRRIAAEIEQAWRYAMQDASDAHEAALLACETWEALVDYDITAGWPSNPPTQETPCA